VAGVKRTPANSLSRQRASGSVNNVIKALQHRGAEACPSRPYAILRIPKNRESAENPHTMKTTILEPIRSPNANRKNSINDPPWARASLFIAALIACFAFLPQMQAVVPAPDGCYPNFTTAEGCDALNFLTTGAGNTGLGWRALFLDTTGSFNTGVGGGALVLNNGDSNTAVGAAALLLNTSGMENTGVGTDAMVFNDAGTNNTAVGAFALFGNIGSNSNTAVGSGALFQNDQTGNAMAGGNTAVGFDALLSNIDGNSNTAVGSGALGNNDSTGNGMANRNTAIGLAALFGNTDGNNNTAVGDSALISNTLGNFNQALGISALHSNTVGVGNIAIGDNALANNVNGSGNTVVGGLSGTNIVAGVGNVYIGRDVDGPADESNTFRTRAIGSTPQVSGINVTIDAISAPGTSGFVKLGHDASSRRYKEEIKPMDKASETLFALKPVTFRAKEDMDPAHVKQYGLIAEDVATVDPNLVIYNSEGKPEALRRDSINAMLLNEFLKEHKRFEAQQTTIGQLKSNTAKQEATISELKKDIGVLTAQIKEQATQIQKVSAWLELNKPAPQAVLNNR
jgi:hypothetical protein